MPTRSTRRKPSKNAKATGPATPGHGATSAHPPDRSHIATEQRNQRTRSLHRLSIAQCVRVINQEDAQVIAALRAAAPAITRFIEAVEPGFCAKPRPGKPAGRLIYVGAGTSGRLGVLDASEAPPTFMVPPDRIIGIIAGGDGALRKSSEGMEDDPDGARAELQRLALTPRDAVLGIAAGGTTPYPNGALLIAKELTRGKCVTGLLTCSKVPQPDHADHLIVLPTGPEVLTGSTRMKAGTATKLALNTISTTLMIRSGRVYQNLMVDMRASNSKLRDRAARIVSTLTGLSRPESFELLASAGDHVKVAIVMHRLGVNAGKARALIDRADGKLGDVLRD